jgi:Ca2+:H+ antiporter
VAGEGGKAGEDEEDEGGLSLPASILWLAAFGGLVAVVSETLVASIDGAAKSWGLGEAFISAILLPVAGNAAEHFSAIIFAQRNRLDLSLGIAVGSSLQIFLFVLPLLVVVGWFAGLPLSLDLQPFEAATLFLSILGSVFLLLHGRSYYMSGVVLLSGYIIVGVGYLVHESKDPADSPLG